MPTTYTKKHKQTKAKKCKACDNMFIPFQIGQKVCGPSCANKYVQQQNEIAKEKEWKQHYKKWKEENKPYYQLVKEAEIEFNAFIRERDKNEPCISCGNYRDKQYLRGSAEHAGHYRAKGAAPHLRFNEDNCHKQCAHCNDYLSGNIVEYRKRLIEKIGLDRVEAVENDNETRKFTRGELKELKRLYKQKVKELKNG